MYRDMIALYKAVLNDGTRLRMWYDHEGHIEVETYDQMREVIPIESVSMGVIDYYNRPISVLKFSLPKGLCQCGKCNG